MPLPAVLGKLIPRPSLDGRRNLIRDAWNLLSGVPGGKTLFSRMVGRAAPYTGSIGATVVALRPGFAQVELQDRKPIRNHLASIHAVALAKRVEEVFLPQQPEPILLDRHSAGL